MRRMFLILSGEHPTLPFAEVRAILETENIAYDIIEWQGRLARLEIKNKYVNSACNKFLKRAAMIKVYGIELFAKSNINDLLEEIRKFDWKEIVGKRSFAVRAVNLLTNKVSVNTQDLERIIGSIIKDKTHAPVNLEHPSVTIQVIVSKYTALVGLRLGSIRRGSYDERRPKRRPFFHPSAMEPRLARVLVNLSRIKEGEIFLDPFCGSGGIMIEAGLIGCYVVGGDILSYMVRGARENLKFFGLDPGSIVLHDARALPFKNVHGIATDPPYGRSATTKGTPLPKLLKIFLNEAYEALRSRRYLVIVSPLGIRVEEYALSTGFKVYEEHRIRVHRSLTRRILVLRKGK